MAKSELDDITDELTSKLQLVEQHLVWLRPGVEASVRLPDVAAQPAFLAFMKREDGWGLYVITCGKWVRLAQASRATRVAAGRSLQALVLEITAVQARALRNVHAALQQVEQFLDRMRGEAHGKHDR